MHNYVEWTGNSTWTETDITWNNMGAYSDTPYATRRIGGSSWEAFDITELAMDWKNGTRNPQCGFVMISDSTTTSMSLYGGEYSNVDYRPYVVVNYTNTVTLDQTSATVYKGDTMTLTATSNPAGQNVTWTSDAPTVAAVSGSGVVTAMSEGTATITATLEDGTTAECEIIVLAKTINFYYNTNTEVYKGNAITLTAYTEPAGELITWISLNPEIATVSDGVVTGVDVGNATIKAALSDGTYAECEVEVLSTNISFGCSCNGDCSDDCFCGCANSINLYIGENVTLTATTVPPNALVNWDSTNPSVATVEDGVVTAISEGETTIRASLDAETFIDCVVIVSSWSISLDCSNIVIIKGNTKLLTATIESPDQSAVWESSDPTVATVGPNGLVTALKAGDAVITATLSNGMATTCAVTVQCSASLGSSFIEIDQYTYKRLRLEELPENAEITWESTNPDVVTVSSDGYIYGIRAGYAYITADSKYLTEPVSVYIHVSLIDGIYYIRNTTGLTISSAGYPQDNGYLYSAVKQLSGESRFSQLFYIKRVACCWYSISPAYDTSLYLDSASSSLILSENTMSLWNISYESSGYVIRKDNTGSTYEIYIQTSDPALGTGQKIFADSVSPAATRQYWNLEEVDGLLVLDAETGAILKNDSLRAIDIGQTAYYDDISISLLNEWGGTIQWSSSDPSIATVSSGHIIGNKRGRCTITLTQTCGNITYTQSFTLRVLEVIYVQNFHDSTISPDIVNLIEDFCVEVTLPMCGIGLKLIQVL